eukprot:367144-Pyramimonas_sp.AAC.1
MRTCPTYPWGRRAFFRALEDLPGPQGLPRRPHWAPRGLQDGHELARRDYTDSASASNSSRES